MLAYVVRSEFSDYKRGHHLTDPEVIETILASDNAHNVVRVNLPDADKPAKK